MAIEVSGGNRIRRINIKAQHSAFSRAKESVIMKELLLPLVPS